jgi:hypothetical protein
MGGFFYAEWCQEVKTRINWAPGDIPGLASTPAFCH